MRKSALGASAALLLLAGPSRAAFDDIGVGARAPGMGNAFVSVADDVYTMYYNPAGLALLPRPELAMSYTRMLIGLTDNSSLSNSFFGYAHPLKGGQWGTSAAGWQQFSLNTNLYQENAFFASYARSLLKGWGPGDLYGGVNAKLLRRSFGNFSEAGNSFNGLAATGRPDPLLSGRKNMSALDGDAGLLYRFPQHYSFGLSVTHLLRPNVAFSSNETDRLPRITRLGVSYRSLLSVLTAQYDNKHAPDGSLDHVFTMAAERWFLRMFVGDFGIRGAMGLGTRDFKQASAGFSYRTRRFNVDYGFAMPLGTVGSTVGSHRLAFSIRFGSLIENDESVEMILEAMRQLKVGTVPELKALGPGLSPAQKSILGEYVANAQSLQAQAQYRAALDRLNQALVVSPNDPELLKNFGRLNFVAQSVKELANYKADPIEAALHQGILAYLANKDALAVEKISYALSLRPEDKRVDGFLAQMELATGLKRDELPKAPIDYELQALVTRAASALEEGRYQEVVDLSYQILVRDPKNVGAWENMGVAYFAMADYAHSLESWQKAYGLEKDPTRRAAQRGYIKSVEGVLSRPKRAGAGMRRFEGDQQELQKIYNQGVDDYTGGRLLKAKEAFEKILQLDPGNVPATKALRRVREELAR